MEEEWLQYGLCHGNVHLTRKCFLLTFKAKTDLATPPKCRKDVMKILPETSRDPTALQKMRICVTKRLVTSSERSSVLACP